MDPMFCTCKNWSGGRQWRIGWLINLWICCRTYGELLLQTVPWLLTLDKAYLWIQKDKLCWGSRTSSFGHWQTCRTVNSPCFVATQWGYKVLCNVREHQGVPYTGFPERMIDYFFSFSEGRHSSLQWTGTFLFHFFRGVPSYIKYFFIWASIMPVHQLKWWFWCVHFHWAVVTAEFLETFAGS